MSIISRNTPIVRHAVVDLSDKCIGLDTGKISKMIRTLYCDHDLDIVREAMIERYAQVIVNEKDEIAGAETTKLYRANACLAVDHAAKTAILAGQREIVRFYLYNSIVSQRATLFSEPSQRWEYLNDGTGDVIGEVRRDGSAQLAAQRWDALSDGVGSCALYISDAGGVLQYSEIPPSRIWYAHAETVSDGGVERPTNTQALDEASVVAIEIAEHDGNRRFAAWFGPCDKWADGRHVIYDGQQWSDIPDVGHDAALDYSVAAGGFVRGALDVANPLSLIARTQGAVGAPTYPICILYGDPLSVGLMPVSSGLYEVCAEIDLMGSMVISAAGTGARGVDVLTRDGTGGAGVPDNTKEGLVLLGRGDEFTKTGWPASHSIDAMNVLNNFARHVAESRGVPGWMVVRDETGEVPSGVALEIMTQPLTRVRNARVELNRQSVARRFAIERMIVNGALGRAAIPYDERETWHAGERRWPTDSAANLQQWQTRITMQEADLADVVQDMRSLRTREEALNWIDERKRERAESEALKDPEPKTPERPERLSLAQRLQVVKAGRSDDAAFGKGQQK